MDDLGLERHEQQHQPRRRDREPRTVDGPGLARLHLRAGAGVVAEVAGQVAQQPAELAATDLAGDPQALDHPVADGVGQPGLEPVEGLAEPPGDLVVERELVERLAQRLGPAGAERRPARRAATCRPARRTPGCRPPPARPRRTRAAAGGPGRRRRRRAGRRPAARRRRPPAGCPRRPGSAAPRRRRRPRTAAKNPVAETCPSPARASSWAARPARSRCGRGRRGQEERRPDQHQPDADAEPDQRPHQHASVRIRWTSIPTRS